MKYLKKLIPILICGLIFSWVVFQIKPPTTFTTATIFQLALFFIPLFFLLFFIFNLILDFILLSLTISVGIMLLLTLAGLHYLNILTGAVTLLAIFLIIKSLKKPTKITYKTKIPRLKKLAQPR